MVSIYQNTVVEGLLDGLKDVDHREITLRKIRAIDHEQFMLDLRFDVYPDCSAEDLACILETELERVLDLHAPLQKLTMSSGPKCPWFTVEVKEQKQVVRRHEKVWRKYQQDHQFVALQVETKKYRKILKSAKLLTTSKLVKECKEDTKKLHQLLGNLRGKITKNPMPTGENNQVLADKFADFFIDKILNIRNQLDNEDLFSPDSQNVETMKSFRLLSEEEVELIIRGLSSKSCELDVIPTSLLKDILPSVLPIITRLINTSLKDGAFVETWKLAIVRPLLKKVGLELIDKNYRPVSNLTFLSKVLEKAALNQFINHCNEHSLLPDYQSAYREHYRCETTLIKLTNNVLWSMERGRVSAVVMIDLSAAFHTVDHGLLLEVPGKCFGLEGTCLRWYANYLCPRVFQVCINDCYSEEKNLTFSVPQGSLNGLFLYLAYASTIKDFLDSRHHETNIYGFVDDHALRAEFVSGSEDEHNRIKELEKTMEDVKIWMDLNRLKMNCSKTEFILMGSRQQLKKSDMDNIIVCGNDIAPSQCQISRSLSGKITHP